MTAKSKGGTRRCQALIVVMFTAALAACGGSGGGGGSNSFAIGTSAGAGGRISPATAQVGQGGSLSFTITPDSGYSIASVTGCGGSLSGNTYTTGPITGACRITASFARNRYTVTAEASEGGSITPASLTVDHGSIARFTVTAEDDRHGIDSVTGCGGTLDGNTYTTAPITGACTVTASFSLLTVSVSDASVVEGDSGTSDLNFTVSLSGQANGQVTVDYATADGTARAGSDYTATSGTATIEVGTTRATVTVPVSGDTVYEPDETLTLTLSNVSANVTQIANPTATGTILSDESATLNDTGIVTCSNAAGNGLACPQTEYPGQDGDFGRDASANDDSDGHAGFSFLKLGADGRPLAIQNRNWRPGGTESAGTRWSCVRDRVTGLTWEMKTDDGGLHDERWTYSWYDSNPATNGGNAGTPNGGICSDAANCDTEKFAAQVNAEAMCGNTDWRVPTVQELLSLVDLSYPYPPGPDIDTAWFPKGWVPVQMGYWSNASYAVDPAKAWHVHFGNGLVSLGLKGLNDSDPRESGHLRLVRGGR